MKLLICARCHKRIEDGDDEVIELRTARVHGAPGADWISTDRSQKLAHLTCPIES